MARLRALVVGTGSIGERHVRCFLRTGRVEISVCEREPTVRERIRTRFGVGAAYATLQEALEGPRFDVALVATPTPLQVPMARRLAARGCHLRPPRLRIMRRPESPWEGRETPLRERDDLYVLQAEAFLDAVAGRGPVLRTLEEASRTLGVTLAALRGLEEQTWLRPLWPPGEAT